MEVLELIEPKTIATAWRVVVHDIYGNTKGGANVHPSKASAYANIREIEDMLANGYVGGITVMCGEVHSLDYSHCVVVPWD